MKFLKNIFAPTLLSNWQSDLLMAIPRVFACYFLAANFGLSKFPTPDWFIEDVAKFGLPFPALLAWAAVITEVVGAGCLVFGLATRFWGGMLICTMVVAIFFQKWDSEVWEKLPAMGFLWVGIQSLVLGSGRFGLDFLISKKWL